MEKFQEVAESQKKTEENKDASAAAGLLEKLSVEEKKTEDKAEEEVPVAAEKETKSDLEKTEKKDEEPASSTWRGCDFNDINTWQYDEIGWLTFFPSMY